MLYYLKTWWRWLRRCSFSRGFGVQSPSAYSFIRYVINEHYPYYAYAELKDRLDMLGKQQHKFGRLLLRLCNYWQPDARYCDETVYYPYMYAGCHRSDVCTLQDLKPSSEEQRLVVIDLDCYPAEKVVSAILPLCQENTLLVLLHLNKANHLDIWEQIQHAEITGITYDLYYVGIVCFDKSVYKQHYQVNF